MRSTTRSLGPVPSYPRRWALTCALQRDKVYRRSLDLVAGIVSGRADLMEQVSLYRTIMGTMADPYGLMMTRSLETVSIRMRRQQRMPKP